MTCNEELADRVRAILQREGAVREVRMFGGVCFMVERGCRGGALARWVQGALAFVRALPPRRSARAAARSVARTGARAAPRARRRPRV